MPMSSFMPLTETQSMIFDITKLHQKYWRTFCDVYYVYFGFETGEVHSYEQKYETFCRRKSVSEEKDYEEKLLYVKIEDLDFLKSYAELFFTQTESLEFIASLYFFVKKMWNIETKLRHDAELLSFICPRCTKVDYSKYLLDESKCLIVRQGNWPNVREVLKSPIYSAMLREILGQEAFDHYTLDSPQFIDTACGKKEYNMADESIRNFVNMFIGSLIEAYNSQLKFFISVQPKTSNYPKGCEQIAFLYRLFMSYEDSLPEIKDILDESPSPLNLEVLQEERNNLITSFRETTLGKSWMQRMQYKDGIEHVAKYFMHHLNGLTKEEETLFFYTLDKICIIEDILKGNADKYRLDVKYPEGWFDNYSSTEDLTSPGCPFVKEPSQTDVILSKIREYQSVKKKPKDLAMPVRAAIDAGVIKRPTLKEYEEVKGFAKIAKSSFEDYTNPCKQPYNDSAYNGMVEVFKKL